MTSAGLLWLCVFWSASSVAALGVSAGAVGVGEGGSDVAEALELGEAEDDFVGHGDDISGERCISLYLAAQGSESPLGAGGLRPCWRGFARWLNTWAGAFAPPRAPSGWWTTLRVAHRLTRGFRAFGAPTSGASPMVLQTLFPPIACRLSRLVSSSGGAAPECRRHGRGRGRSPPGAGAAGPAVQGGNRPPLGD